MAVHLLHRFNSLARHCYTTSLVQGQHDILGVLMTLKGDDPTSGKVALALINIQKQTSEQIIVFDGTGPENLLAMEMLLQYDLLSMRWVIAQLQSFEYIAMRTLTIAPNGETKLSPLCLLDYDDAAETPGINALLALAVKNNIYSFLYPKPFDVHLTSPQIVKLDVTIQQPMWDTLKDEAVSVSSKNISLALPLHPKKVFLPDNVAFDPSTNNAHQTSGVHITNRTILAEAELSMTYVDQHFHLLVLCSPEHTVKTQGALPSVTPHEGRQWRIWLTGWDNSWNRQHWTYSPDLGVPFPIDPAGYKYTWPTAYVAAISGPPIPPHSTASVVVALTIGQQEEILSHSVCLDEKGDIVQTCATPLGLYPSLCCCKHIIVGVDRFEGNWRLWNWPVIEERELDRKLSLEPSCQRAFVQAELASERFWLIEELPDGVRVTHRNASTLEETAPEVYLPGMRLEAESPEHPLNGYQNAGLVSYQDSLLLLVNSASSGELVLYQLQ